MQYIPYLWLWFHLFICIYIINICNTIQGSYKYIIFTLYCGVQYPDMNSNHVKTCQSLLSAYCTPNPLNFTQILTIRLHPADFPVRTTSSLLPFPPNPPHHPLPPNPPLLASISLPQLSEAAYFLFY